MTFAVQGRLITGDPRANYTGEGTIVQFKTSHQVLMITSAVQLLPSRHSHSPPICHSKSSVISTSRQLSISPSTSQANASNVSLPPIGVVILTLPPGGIVMTG